MARQITRREAAALAAGAALGASLPVPAAALPLPLPAKLPVAAILEPHPDSWQDGSLWIRAVVDRLGWTEDRARRVVKATLHDYCRRPYEEYTRQTWLSDLCQEIDRAAADPGYDERPDVIERARIGKEGPRHEPGS